LAFSIRTLTTLLKTTSPINRNGAIDISIFLHHILSYFRLLYLIYPDAAIAYLKNIVHRFRVVIKQLDHVSLDKSEDRILNLLNLLLEEDISDFPNDSLPFSHEEVAMFAGLNRVTTTRAIDKLQKKEIFTTTRCNIRAVRGKNSLIKYKMLPSGSLRTRREHLNLYVPHYYSNVGFFWMIICL
jgi:hypothetical protein